MNFVIIFVGLNYGWSVSIFAVVVGDLNLVVAVLPPHDVEDLVPNTDLARNDLNCAANSTTSSSLSLSSSIVKSAL